MDKKTIAALLMAGGGIVFFASIAQPTQSPNAKVTQWDDEIHNALRATGVSPAIIAATIEIESGGRPTATGTSGEFGLMQLMCPTAEQVGFSGACENLFVPKVNILFGAKYLAWQSRRYGGNLEKVFSAYNAGTATSKNRQYVNKAMSAYRRYLRYYGGIR